MFIDATGAEAVNEAHLTNSKWAKENIGLANLAADMLKAAALLDLPTNDGITMRRLGIRLINALGAGGSAAMSGYYQQAAGQVRDIIEVSLLLDWFQRDPKQINRWRVCGAKARRNNFSASAVRLALDKLDKGKPAYDREKAYAYFSRHGTHVDADSFVLMSPNMQTQVGPFPDRDRVVGLSFDFARYVSLGSSFLLAWLRHQEVPKDKSAEDFAAAANAYTAYLQWFRNRTTLHTD